MVLKHQLICWLEVRDLQEGPVRLSNTIPRVKVPPTGTSGSVECDGRRCLYYPGLLLGFRGPNRGYTSVPNSRAEAIPVTDAPISEGFRIRLETNKPNPKSSALATLRASGRANIHPSSLRSQDLIVSIANQR